MNARGMASECRTRTAGTRPTRRDARSLRSAAMVSVAIDSGPLHGPRTGIGNAVAWTLDALAALPDDRGVDLRPYVVSMRARTTPPERRLPIPAAVAHRLWARTSIGRVDRFLA